MKLRNWFFGGGIMPVILALAAGGLHAQTVTNVFTIASVAQTQGETNVTNSVVTIQEPTFRQIATRDLLTLLAQDKRAQGIFSGTNFPEGASLVVISTGVETGGGPADFQVLDQNGRFLFDVSNFVSLTVGTNIVTSGSINKNTGLLNPTLNGQSMTIFEYDDLGLPGGNGLEFFLIGLMTRTVTDLQPNSMGVLEQIQASSMPNGQGTGTFQGIPLVISGSINLNGQTTLVVVRSASTIAPTINMPTAATPAVPTMVVPTAPTTGIPTPPTSVPTAPVTATQPPPTTGIPVVPPTAIPGIAATNSVGTTTNGGMFIINGGGVNTSAGTMPSGTNSITVP